MNEVKATKFKTTRPPATERPELYACIFLTDNGIWCPSRMYLSPNVRDDYANGQRERGRVVCCFTIPAETREERQDT